jgi:hypothetical protein
MSSKFLFSEAIIKYASNFPRKELLSFGTCFGRFTKTRKFRLHITALDFIAPYAKVREKKFSFEIIFFVIISLKFGLNPMLNNNFSMEIMWLKQV